MRNGSVNEGFTSCCQTSYFPLETRDVAPHASDSKAMYPKLLRVFVRHYLYGFHLQNHKQEREGGCGKDFDVEIELSDETASWL